MAYSKNQSKIEQTSKSIDAEREEDEECRIEISENVLSIERRLKNAILRNDKLMEERTSRMSEIQELKKQAQEMEASYANLEKQIDRKSHDFKKMEEYLSDRMKEINIVQEKLTKHCHYMRRKVPVNTSLYTTDDCLTSHSKTDLESESDYLGETEMPKKNLIDELTNLQIDDNDYDSQSDDYACETASSPAGLEQCKNIFLDLSGDEDEDSTSSRSENIPVGIAGNDENEKKL